MRKGHGNTKSNQKRRRNFNKNVERQTELYPMIDNNLTYYPYAYCSFYKGYMTASMTDRHNCVNRNCPHYKDSNIDKYLEGSIEWYNKNH